MLNTNRLIRLLAAGLTATTFAVGAVACGATQPAETTPKTTEQEQKPPAKEDQAFEGFEEVQVTGELYAPEALGIPNMPSVKPKRVPTLDQQRKSYAKAKPAKKAQEAKVLVSLLWDAAIQAHVQAENDQTATEEAKAAAKQQASALREEARTVLRELHASLGEGFDAILTQMLFTAELWLGDQAAAAPIGQELVTRFPDSASAKALAPWVGYVYLNQWNTDAAAQLVADWTLEDADFSRAYIIGWVAFRQGDYPRAREAMMHAARVWKLRSTWPMLERELARILAFGGTPVDEAATIVAELSQNIAANQYYWLYQINESYALAGDFLKAAAALDKAAEAAGAEMPVDNMVTFRRNQSDYYLLEYQPEKAADYIIQAHQAVEACGEKCASVQGVIAEQIAKMAPYLHTIYTTTLDERYYTPAKKLYDFYLSLNRPDAETLRTYLSRLEETKKVSQQVSGKHSKDIMDRATSVRMQDFKGCYERVLQGSPELQGSLQIMLDVDETGAVTGLTTEPAAGDAGLGAVAKCIDAEARAWMFPGRSLPGTTRVIRTYVLSLDAKSKAALSAVQAGGAQPAAGTETQPTPAQ